MECNKCKCEDSPLTKSLGKRSYVRTESQEAQYYVIQCTCTGFVECAETPGSLRMTHTLADAMFWGSTISILFLFLSFPHKTSKFTSTKHPPCRESPASLPLSCPPDTDICAHDSDVYFDIAINSGYCRLQSPVSLTHV